MIDKEKCAALIQTSEEYGTPFYAYYAQEITTRVNSIRKAFNDNFKISYAVKSNPNLAILRLLSRNVDGLDVSSAGEIKRALDAGWEGAKLSFTGPGKTMEELKYAIDSSTGEVVLESTNEAIILNNLAKNAGIIQPVLIRISPSKTPQGFGVHMAGRPTQFGIDEEDLDAAIPFIQTLDNLAIAGLHIYSGSQCLKSEALIENYNIYIDIFKRIANSHNVPLKKLIFGGGIGIPYHEGDSPVDLNNIGSEVIPMLKDLRGEKAFKDSEFILELGRYITGEAGLYVTKVVNIKHSRGAHIAICDGGMNHHLAAAGHLGSVIQRNFEIFKLGGKEAKTEQYNISGPLCTSIDMLAQKISLRELNTGDLLAIRSSGAYGPTASPVNFISHEPPREMLIETKDGNQKVSDITE